MKRIFGFLLVLCALFVLISCGNGVDWNDSNGFNNAKYLESTHKEDNEKLVINVDNKDKYLNNITKDKIIVKARGNNSSSDTKELTGAELQKDAIKDYELLVEDNNIKITLPSYEKSIYVVVFNKSITKDNNFAYAYNSLIEDKHNNQPYVNIEDLKYLCGDENPIFIVYYKNINIADKNKIEFSGAFADLSLMNCQVDSEYIKIITDGTISDGDFGFVTLKGGFFEGIDTDIDLYFAVYSVAYHIDCSTLKLENNELSFVALFSNKSFDNIGIDNVNFDPFDISKVEIVGEKKDGLKIYIPFEGTFDEVLSRLAFGKIVVDEDPTDNLSGMEISFDINFPTFDLYSELKGKDLIIHFRYHDVITNDIKMDNIQIESSNLRLTGDNANAALKEIIEVSNGFDYIIETSEELDEVDGTFKIVSESPIFKTLWGVEQNIPPIYFGCTNDNKVVLQSYQKGEYEESFSETMITAKPDVDTVAHVLQFAGYAAQLGVAIYKGDAFQIIGSVMNIAQLFGLTGKSGEPTIQDVLNKLQDMDNQLKAIDRKMDALKQQMLDSTTAIQLGVDKILFNQYRSTWDSFYENYIEKIEDLLRNYTTDVRTYYVNFVRNTDDVALELKYFTTNDNKTILSMENPDDPNHSLEGYPFASSKSVTINKSYFTDAANLTRRSQGYSDDFDDLFRKCLKNNLKASYPDLSDADFDSLFNDVYGHIAGLAQFSAVKADTAKNMRNLFVDFAKQLSGKATGTSKMVYYYKMLESLYNFQSEAETEMKQFRVNMKKLLDEYAGYATIMAQFCSGIDKSEITNSYNDAYEYIKNNDNMRKVGQNQDYCYTINSNIAANVVRCSFDKGFNDAGKNKCSFWYNYKTYNEETDQTIDVVNNSKLLSDANLSIIHARAVNILQYSGQSGDVSLFSYFQSKGIITSNMKKKYNGTQAITSYTGINDPSTSSFNVICTSVGVGNYFDYGTTYSYKGSRESDCWSAREASGTIFDLASNKSADNHINRMARYDESHWYWSTDEHWAFEEYITGKIAFAIIRA